MADDIAQWLEGLGLGQYVKVLAENNVDLDVLTDLTDADFKDLNIPLGDRKRLLRGMAELSHGSTASVEASSESPSQTASHVEAEHRQLTVMFCDLVGSTALSYSEDIQIQY